MNKAIFLDRDGTINVDKNYVFKIEDLEFEVGVIEALKKFKKMGYKLIVISNQSGIARKYFTEKDLELFNSYMNEILKENQAEIDEFYCCPHHPKINGDCECRKPKNKFIEEAIKKYDIDRNISFMVGDKLSDIEAGIKSNLKPILVKTGKGKNEAEKLKDDKTLVFENLKKFSEFLID